MKRKLRLMPLLLILVLTAGCASSNSATQAPGNNSSDYYAPIEGDEF